MVASCERGLRTMLPAARDTARNSAVYKETAAHALARYCACLDPFVYNSLFCVTVNKCLFILLC
jgi:hypothetical protein